MIDFEKNPLSVHLGERLRDPFLGAYTFFVIFCNWKIWLLIFSKMDIFLKIEHISILIKKAHFRAFWLPLIFVTLYFILSSLFKTLTKYFLQNWQKIDDYVLPFSLDSEKINLIKINNNLIGENEKLSKKILEYSSLSQYVMYFSAQQASNIANVNNLLNQERIPSSVANMYEASHELVKGIENMKSSIKNNIEKGLIKID
jgi:hypothetical protein